MAYGIIGFSAAGNAGFPSPSIWGDCLNDELKEQAQGYYFYQDFVSGVVPGTYSGTSGAGSTQTFAVDTNTAEVLDWTVGAGTSNASIGFFGPQPVGPITSGNRLWFETAIAYGTVTNTTSASFIGLTTLAGEQSALITGTTTTGLVTNTTLIGFQQVGGTNGNLLNLVQQNGTNGLNVLQANVTNSPSITANGGTIANLTAGAFVKLGLRFDGKYIYSYVNGVQASKTLVDSTFDQTSVLGATLQQFVGSSGATVTNKVGFIREASELSALA